MPEPNAVAGGVNLPSLLTASRIDDSGARRARRRHRGQSRLRVLHSMACDDARRCERHGRFAAPRMRATGSAPRERRPCSNRRLWRGASLAVGARADDASRRPLRDR